MDEADARGATWRSFVEDDPQLAGRIRSRFEANRHHIVGTLRTDGSPRLSGTEVAITADDVTVGMMPGSRKLADVQRDPRVELHSAPLEEDLAGGDAKLSGVLVQVPQPEGGEPGSYFELRLLVASLVRVEHDELVVATWRPERGTRTVRRP